MAMSVTINGSAVDLQGFAYYLQVNADIYPRNQVDFVLRLLGVEAQLLPLEREGSLPPSPRALVRSPSLPPYRSHYLVYNCLSQYWTWSHFKANPAGYTVLYAFGVVAYAISLVLRVFIFVVNLLRWITGPFYAVCSEKTFCEEMKERTWVLLGAIGELFSGVVGTLCPPLAYEIDEWIQSNPTIHAWYLQTSFSYWSEEFPYPGRELTLDERMALKSKVIDREGDALFFKNGQRHLTYFLSDEDACLIMPAQLELVGCFGFLEMFCQFLERHSDLESLEVESFEGSPLQKYVVDGQLLGHLNRFLPVYSELRETYETDLLLSTLRSILVLEQAESFTFRTETLEGELRRSLGEMESSHKIAADDLAGSIKSFSRTVRTRNREWETLIGQMAFADVEPKDDGE